MIHIGTKNIETERLLLRKFQMSDAELMFNNWASDDDVTKFLTWTSHENIEQTKQILKLWIDQYQNKNFYQWAIVLKNIDEPIGSIGVVKNNDDINMVHIGYCIGKKWWGSGFTSEAFKAVIKYFFTKTDVIRIEAVHDVNNSNSGKVMQKCNMKYEGVLRKAGINNQGICDICSYSIISEDML